MPVFGNLVYESQHYKVSIVATRAITIYAISAKTPSELSHAGVSPKPVSRIGKLVGISGRSELILWVILSSADDNT